ncbi:hypothetical protein SKAU_G00144580 [Synaphobranchus kaupii]|uniref:Uncharacterized protein n=1 Tax=Synaphobranchus kaupii TaxID=118154 RepID=A0A9Q1J2G9_SYNKA|nr:hypothetical protein SKAU_G00144580 [Synaphobranchus kaupii]
MLPPASRFGLRRNQTCDRGLIQLPAPRSRAKGLQESLPASESFNEPFSPAASPGAWAIAHLVPRLQAAGAVCCSCTFSKLQYH